MYSGFCHAPAAAEQKDFTTTCLCLTPPHIYTPNTPLCAHLASIYPLVAKTWPFSPRFTDPTAPVSTAALSPLAI